MTGLLEAWADRGFSAEAATSSSLWCCLGPAVNGTSMSNGQRGSEAEFPWSFSFRIIVSLSIHINSIIIWVQWIWIDLKTNIHFWRARSEDSQALQNATWNTTDSCLKAAGEMQLVGPAGLLAAVHYTGARPRPKTSIRAPGLSRKIRGATKPPQMKMLLLCCESFPNSPRIGKAMTLNSIQISHMILSSYFVIFCHLTCSLLTFLTPSRAFVRASAQRQRLWPHAL